MRRLIILFIGILLLGGLALAGPASAQLQPFGCVEQAFMVQNQDAELSFINQSVSPFTFDTINASTGIEYNNLAYRTTDGYLYAVQLTTLSGSAATTWGNLGFVRIGQGGVYQSLGWPGYPTATAPWGGNGTAYPRFDAGDISSDGTTMYITLGAATDTGCSANPSLCANKLYMLDLTGVPAPGAAAADLSGLVTNITISGDDGNVNDWAYNPANGLLYGGDRVQGQVAVLNTTTGIRTDYAVTGLPSGDGPQAYGGAWFDANGRLYLYRNNGEIYGIDLGADLLTPTVVFSQTAALSSTRNDATACAAGIGNPLITLTKTVTTAGGTCPGVENITITAGDTVKYCYNVTNLATTGILYNVTLIDDNGTPLDPGDDFTVTLSGLTNIDGNSDDLAAGASATGEALVTRDTPGTIVNTANATGNDLLGVSLSDLDNATVIVEAAPVPQISIEKYTNGEDADNPTGPTITVGANVTWEYRVNNTGNVNLTDINVTDDQGVTPVYQSGDDGDDGILEPGEVWIYNVTGTVTVGQYANNGTANGTYDETEYSDTDPSHYLGEEEAAPALTIEKFTNGQDADSPTGPTLTEGETVTWEYRVNNTGNVNLTDINVTDDQGVTPVYQSGDDGDDGILEPGEVWIYNVTGTVTVGQYANNGTANGTYDETEYSDTDPSHYLGEEEAAPALTIEKFTNGQDADSPTGPTLTEGETVTWEYRVNNTGNVNLTDINVTDDQGVTPVYQSGDDGDNILQPGEVWIYNVTGTVTVGQYANNGTANGTYDETEYSDTDPSHYLGEEEAAPALTIEKFTNGQDADSPTGPVLTEGETVTWEYRVNNTGNVNLTDINVTDDQGVTVTCPQTTLAVGTKMTCTASGTALAGQYSNNGTATGYYDGMEANDTDPSHYCGIDAPGVGTPGYWKNHPEAWPVANITIGGEEFTKAEAIAIMNEPVQKDKTYTMFPALVAAKLNVLIGNPYDECDCACEDCGCVDEAGLDFISEADEWFAELFAAVNNNNKNNKNNKNNNNKLNLIGVEPVRANSKDWKEGETYYEWLDWYNNGYCFCAPHRY
jgi:hypothetical protein